MFFWTKDRFRRNYYHCAFCSTHVFNNKLICKFDTNLPPPISRSMSAKKILLQNNCKAFYTCRANVKTKQWFWPQNTISKWLWYYRTCVSAKRKCVTQCPYSLCVELFSSHSWSHYSLYLKVPHPLSEYIVMLFPFYL